nr:PAS domain-containing protein [Kordiimonas laminariae]
MNVEFQKRILAHWEDIRQSRKFPSKQDFRPQNFSRYLPQLAIVSFDDTNFSDRLIGSTVIEMLGYAMGAQYQEDTRLGYNSQALRHVLETSKEEAQPLYFTGELSENSISPVEFCALALPFSLKSEKDEFDTIILAFEFQKKSLLHTLKQA